MAKQPLDRSITLDLSADMQTVLDQAEQIAIAELRDGSFKRSAVNFVVALVCGAIYWAFSVFGPYPLLAFTGIGQGFAWYRYVAAKQRKRAGTFGSLPEEAARIASVIGRAQRAACTPGPLSEESVRVRRQLLHIAFAKATRTAT